MTQEQVMFINSCTILEGIIDDIHSNIILANFNSAVYDCCTLEIKAIELSQAILLYSLNKPVSNLSS
jgi:hypothetical protein